MCVCVMRVMRVCVCQIRVCVMRVCVCVISVCDEGVGGMLVQWIEAN